MSYDWDSPHPGEDNDLVTDDETTTNDDGTDNLIGIEADEELREALSEWDALKRGAEFEKEYAEAEKRGFQDQLEELARLDPDYVPPHVDEPIEKIAIEAGKDYLEFAEMLRADIANQRAKARATQPGYDSDGEPVGEVEPFDPSRLTKAQFKSLTAAVMQGYTPEQWMDAEALA